MAIPSRAEVQAAAERVLAEIDKARPSGPSLSMSASECRMLGDCRILAEAALRRVAPAPKDPREDYAGDEFAPSGPYSEPLMSLETTFDDTVGFLERRDEVRRTYAGGHADTCGNVAAVLEEVMEHSIEELAIWRHKRDGYEVEVGPRGGPNGGEVKVKDDDAATWSPAVIYRKTEEGEGGDVYVRTEAAFRAKFEFVRNSEPEEVEEALEEAAEATDTASEPPVGS